MKVCIAVHDVAPTTWPACKKILAMLQDLGAPPVTLLVVPDFHDLGRADECRELRLGIHQCQERGHEIALHGYRHLDDSASARSLGDWFRRRILTASEGEFAALEEEEAFRRIDDGLRMLRTQGWAVSGFVPPAWLASEGAIRATKNSGLRYMTDHRSIIDFRENRRIVAPVITASVRNRWRRGASRVWLRTAGRLLSNCNIVRVGLHPADACDSRTLSVWRSVLSDLLATREALTKLQAVRSCAEPDLRVERQQTT